MTTNDDAGRGATRAGHHQTDKQTDCTRASVEGRQTQLSKALARATEWLNDSHEKIVTPRPRTGDGVMSLAVEIARRAIAVTARLSPSMRNALCTAARETPHGRPRVGWTGHVPHRTIDALARRGIVADADDGTLTVFGRIVHAVVVTSETDVLVWAGQQDAAALIAEARDIVIGGGVAIAHGDDPATVAFRTTLLDELHTRALLEDISRGDATGPRQRPTCDTDGHEDRAAIAVLIHAHLPSPHLGASLCGECATCADCDALGDIMQAPHWKPWCQPHADALNRESGPDERATGPDIVLLNSERHRALTTQHEEHLAGVGRFAAQRWLPSRARGRATSAGKRGRGSAGAARVNPPPFNTPNQLDAPE